MKKLKSEIIEKSAESIRDGLREVLLSEIIADPKAQPRQSLNEALVQEYVFALRNGDRFPPVVLFGENKRFYLADGFHRLMAHRIAGLKTIEAYVKAGDLRGAILFSTGANEDHGLRRTPEDKRKAVFTLLKDDEWSQWSDREIARIAKVSNTFVSNLRGELRDSTVNVDSEGLIEGAREFDIVRFRTKYGTEANMKVSRQNKNKTKKEAANKNEKTPLTPKEQKTFLRQEIKNLNSEKVQLKKDYTSEIKRINKELSLAKKKLKAIV
ncbi:ParB/RepB/Spo0J family partition protein [Leptospira licerasiae]|uniref:ParB-like protein n=1 Tax=Leptospira licerasiae str. MMD4847 TaxID=1049971 RepID=A0ABP2RIP6_9LEPT|nr:ParB N-terminal domain-containing protein [Leptospira licerasiae]EIE01442.1 ParB-like protein [Leptospira licerasiae serovar Varillal str. VAR 010]EJZ42308.1 ParB-like protein [Leptospira licerasiae str. MMD4847]